jgi:hypothetical protein
VGRRAKKSRVPKREPASFAAEIRDIRATLDHRLTTLEELQRICEIQFQRIAQIQAELDLIKKVWANVKPL